MRITSLEPGQTVYSVSRRRMGSTKATTVDVHPVKIVSVDVESGTVVAEWNYNPGRKFYRSQWSKWRLKEPELVKSGFGYRIKTRKDK